STSGPSSAASPPPVPTTAGRSTRKSATETCSHLSPRDGRSTMSAEIAFRTTPSTVRGASCLSRDFGARRLRIVCRSLAAGKHRPYLAERDNYVAISLREMVAGGHQVVGLRLAERDGYFSRAVTAASRYASSSWTSAGSSTVTAIRSTTSLRNRLRSR